MTDRDYQNLVKESVIYKTLDQRLKDKVLMAKGEDRKRYLEIIKNVAESFAVANHEFQQRNAKITSELNVKISLVKKAKLGDEEVKERTVDKGEQEKLLTQLKQI